MIQHGATTSAALFDSTIGRVNKNFNGKTATLHIDVLPGDDSLDINVKITNLTGHKLPTGIPFRRMWIELKILNSLNQTIFHSGFTTAHPSYDSVKIYGVYDDPNFNKTGNIEGSGADIVTYRIKTVENGELTIQARLCYQTMKPSAINKLAGLNTPEATRFISMWQNEDHSPSIIATETKNFTVTSTKGENGQALTDEFIKVYPNPLKEIATVSFRLNSTGNVDISMFNPLGEKVMNLLSGTVPPGIQNFSFNSRQLTNGVYFLIMKSESGIKSVKLLVVR